MVIVVVVASNVVIREEVVWVSGNFAGWELLI